MTKLMVVIRKEIASHPFNRQGPGAKRGAGNQETLWTGSTYEYCSGSGSRPTIDCPVLANERTQIRSDPVPGLSVDTLGAFRVEIAVTRSESDLDRSG